MIYLDNASTTQVSVKFKDIIDKYLYSNFGNAGSPHLMGGKSKKAIDSARRQVASFVNTEPDNIIFTSSGSEANTMAILGLSKHLSDLNLKHIITSKYEHHSVLNAMKEMERRGFEVTYLDVSSGMVSYDDFVSNVRDDTGLVSIMYVNNEIGAVNDVKSIYKFCQEREILFHSDCVQAAGVNPIDMNEIADLVSISGHKIYAPKGIGCLCAKHKQFLSNVIFGGEQEYGLRPGTENVAYIAAFGMATYYANANMNYAVQKLNSLNSEFMNSLYELCNENDIKIHINSASPTHSPKILNIRFEGIDANTLVLMLSNAGVCVSAGSACSSHSMKPSHVLKALGYTDENARESIRISFSEKDTIDNMNEAARIIVDCVKVLRKM